MSGDPSRIRTCNPRSRNPLLVSLEIPGPASAMELQGTSLRVSAFIVGAGSVQITIALQRADIPALSG